MIPGTVAVQSNQGVQFSPFQSVYRLVYGIGEIFDIYVNPVSCGPVPQHPGLDAALVDSDMLSVIRTQVIRDDGGIFRNDEGVVRFSSHGQIAE